MDSRYSRNRGLWLIKVVLARGAAASLILAGAAWPSVGDPVSLQDSQAESSSTSAPRWTYSRDTYPGENFRETGPGQTRQIRQRLRLAGLSSQRIDNLASLGFSYGRVRQAVEEAAQNQGYGPDNARRRGHEVAQQIQRLKERESYPVSEGQSYPVSDSRSLQSQDRSWRSQQINEKLQQVGLDQETIQSLQHRGFVPAQIEATIRESLLDRGYQPGSAEMRARNLTNQIREIREGASALDIRQLLSEAGLTERQIARLERQGFERLRVQILVQDALEDGGYSQSRAERRARDIARQVEAWRSRVR